MFQFNKKKYIDISLNLIKILSNGKFFSIEKLSKIFKINYKEIEFCVYILKKWGVNFSLNVQKPGYKLLKSIQLINKNFIYSKLEKKVPIFFIPIIDSTNQFLINRINFLSLGSSCISEYQEKGRGRFGRSWFSPFGVNIYLSIYWCFHSKIFNTIGISIVTGIAVAKILKDIGVKNIKIKWPNDLYLKNKKLAGILVEVIKKNKSSKEKVIIGIGINFEMFLTKKNQIKKNWINLRDTGIKIDRNLLIAILINKLRKTFLEFEKTGLTSFISSWSKLDIYFNKPVKLIIQNSQFYGISKGINMQGAFLLDQNNTISSWIYGKISVRKN